MVNAMAPKPLTREEIANTEKKLDMPLDDIIKMSQNMTTTKPKKQRRAPNKRQKVFNNAAQEKASKVQRYMDTRPFVRQGFLAQRRSNFQGNQFPLATEVARKSVVAPLRNRPFNQNGGANSNKARVGSFMVRRRAAIGGFAAKPLQHQRQQQQQPQGDAGSKQRPQTLDSLFANMKEQRVRVLSRQNNGVKWNGNGSRPRVPWARGRFGY